MKTFLAALALSLALVPSAQAEEKKRTAQQERMKNCNAEAKEKSLKGDERKAFMKTCLSSGKKAEGSAEGDKAVNPQQSKMKDCNAQAKEKKIKGKERKEFMSACLKSS